MPHSATRVPSSDASQGRRGVVHRAAGQATEGEKNKKIVYAIREVQSQGEVAGRLRRATSNHV